MTGLIAGFLAWSGREMTRIRRRWPWLRRALPLGAVRRLVALRSRLTETRRYYIRVEHRSSCANVYHCAVQKTGSQWLMSILSDVAVYRWSGLSHYHFQTRSRVQGRPATAEDLAGAAIPERAIVSPLMVPYPAFAALRKPASYRAFFVLRDPRELVVSWYFSTLRTHLSDGDRQRPLNAAREALAALDLEDGLCYSTDALAGRGRFDALSGWAAAAGAHPEVLLVRFENLVAEGARGEFHRVFDFCDIRIPDPELVALLAAYDFRRLTGREPGVEDTTSHLRSGAASTWPRYFTPRVAAHFAARTGSLARDLGY